MNKLPFGRANYTLMIAGVLVILLGFIIMNLDTAPFGFGTMGLLVGPLIVATGFALEFFAILRRSPNQ